MKKSVGSFIALNRRAFLLIGIVLNLGAFGVIAWQTSAKNRTDDSSQDKQQAQKEDPNADGLRLLKDATNENPNVPSNDKDDQDTVRGVSTAVKYDVSPSQNSITLIGLKGKFRGVMPVVRADVSPPLRDIPPVPRRGGEPREREDDFEAVPGASLGPQSVDPLVQQQVGPLAIPTPIISFNGMTNIDGVAPPDPVGDVSPGFYVAMGNSYLQVFDKSGTSLMGPVAINTLWSGFGGACQTENAGDPVVLYDQLADRWLISQFTASGPTYFNCVALSVTGNPTGSYQRYAVSSGTNFPDYPKYGIWPDGYYISTREFAGASFAGVGAYALNRAQMLAGSLSPTTISMLAPSGGVNNGNDQTVGDGLLPTDLDGITLPPAGRANYYIGTMDDGGPYTASQDALVVWRFMPDFTTPANSTMTLTNTLATAAFDSIFNDCAGRACIPQPGTANKIDILSYRQRPLHRLAYRNFGDHEALVTNQSVEAATGPSIAGIRWYEVRLNGAGTPSIFQQGTYAPGTSDGIHRWMGSIAMDASGNMALGYSASNATTTFPSVWYTGRLAGDPLGTMPQGEASIINGTGSQTGSQRWGDYTSMNVDPVDDCTFWYVNEWVPTTSSVGWRLRIGSFKFPTCVSLPTAAGVTIGGRIQSAGGRNISRAVVSLTDANGHIRTALSNPFGLYQFVDVAAGETYFLTVTAKGYEFTPQVVTATQAVTTLDFTAL